MARNDKHPKKRASGPAVTTRRQPATTAPRPATPPQPKMTPEVPVACFLWSQLDDGRDYRFLQQSSGQSEAIEAEAAPLLDKLGYLIAKAIPFEGWLWFPLSLGIGPCACCCHLTRGTSQHHRGKVALYAIVAREADLQQAGLTSPVQMAHSAIWTTPAAFMPGSAAVRFQLTPPSDASTKAGAPIRDALMAGGHAPVTVEMPVAELVRGAAGVPRAFTDALAIIAPDNTALLTILRESRASCGLDFPCLLVSATRACPQCGKEPCGCVTSAPEVETIYTVSRTRVQSCFTTLRTQLDEIIKNDNDCMSKLKRMTNPKPEHMSTINMVIEAIQRQNQTVKSACTEHVKAVHTHLDRLDTFLKENQRDGLMTTRSSARLRDEDLGIQWHCPKCRQSACACASAGKTDKAPRLLRPRDGETPGTSAPDAGLAQLPHTAQSYKETLTRLRTVPEHTRRIVAYHQGWLLGILARLAETIDQAQYGASETRPYLQALRGVYAKQLEHLHDDLHAIHAIPFPKAEPVPAPKSKSSGARQTKAHAAGQPTMWHKIWAFVSSDTEVKRSSKRKVRD